MCATTGLESSQQLKAFASRLYAPEPLPHLLHSSLVDQSSVSATEAVFDSPSRGLMRYISEKQCLIYRMTQ